MKVIISGGRDFNDFDLLDRECDKIFKDYSNPEIVSGCAKGADGLAIRYANENYYQIKTFPANWTRYGKSAGAIRNKEMADYSDMLIAFWDGKSKGTKMMIDIAMKANLIVKILTYLK